MNTQMADDYEFPFSSEFLSDEEKKVWNEIYTLPLSKIIEEFDKTLDGDSILDSDRYDVIRGIIADKLGLISRDMFGPIFASELNELSDKIKELQTQFKSHRHDASKSYTTKPEW